jgi:ATP-dependent RNA helicase DDX54/DBP10
LLSGYFLLIVVGLNSNLLKSITRKGFSVPTPIQRKTIPLVLDGQDVVGMARTGSGKTAAFVIPMIQKLKAHSAKVGARALILSPSRELALQTLKVVKELGRGTDLKCVLLVGGDSLEEQFSSMTGNPDIVIATPGRFLHLQVEMSLDLSSIRYVVFDEADRLFEMGFAAQLTEILYALPASRQTLLFSATLPKSLVEFARAGLQEPTLVRLDAESKISSDLESAFFTIKTADKEGALLHILSDIIKIPTGSLESSDNPEIEKGRGKKRKRESGDGSKASPTEYSTIIFTATKHHVEYVATLLRLAGFAVSHAYGALDQTARKTQVQDFRNGTTNILVVTDVAARGIDIPILANVINYDFPPQPKIFVHRVGRTARAGKRGWSYSLVRDADAPYLLDLQLFLGRRLILGRTNLQDISFSTDVIVGGLVREKLGRSAEWVTKLIDDDADLRLLQSVAGKGEKLYLRTRNSASAESAKRSKEITSSKDWTMPNVLFVDADDTIYAQRDAMLARVSGFRPQETVFELGRKGAGGEAAQIMKRRREKIDPRRTEMEEQREREGQHGGEEEIMADNTPRLDSSITRETTLEKGDYNENHTDDMDTASEAELEVTFSHPGAQNRQSYQDPSHFMAYTPSTLNLAEDRGYGVHSGSNLTASQSSNFVLAAAGATMDIGNDEGAKAFAEPSKTRGMRWDKKSKKYVARVNDEDGSKGARMIRGESGQKIAASFKSGRFDAWRRSNKIGRAPRIGEAERPGGQRGPEGKRYTHKAEKAPKEADRYRDDYHVRKKRVEEAKEKRVGKFRDGSGKAELKSVEDVRKARKIKENKMKKNARPSKGRRG